MSIHSKIAEIYMGHIDAKDEINYGTEEQFIESFVMPPNFNINEILDSHKFMISGFKGVGKTALLYYLESLCVKNDNQSCTSFMLFKSDFGDIEKHKLDTAAKRLVQSISFDKSQMGNVSDFTDIWRIIFYQRLVEDNEEFSNNLFVQDDNWIEFEKQVKSIRILNRSNQMIMRPRKVKLFSSIQDNGIGTGGIEFDFEKTINMEKLSIFNEKINNLTRLFIKLKRTDIPYFIFVDELEAFYEDENIFKRDLTMLRDLILTIKELNFLMIQANMNETKIVCSVRTEILNSIHRFIPTKELNKAISGFECRLNWDYTNTVAIQHPLFQILLKRLMVTDQKKGIEYENLNEVFEEWFTINNNTDRLVNHILTSLWNKPRDVIRLIGAMKNSTSSQSDMIQQEVINHSTKEYSLKSLDEISGELNAIYKPNQIRAFQSLLRGYKSPFTLDEFKSRISEFTNLKLFLKDISIEIILSDLYRVGIIGNYNPYLEKHRWQHKHDDEIIIDEGWLFPIHNGLNSSLSIVRAKSKQEGDKRVYYDLNSKALKKGTRHKGLVTNIRENRVLLDIISNDRLYKGSIHISNVKDEYIRDLNDYFTVSDNIKIQILEHNSMYKSWNTKYIEHIQNEINEED